MYMYIPCKYEYVFLDKSNPPTLPQLLKLDIPLHVADKYKSFGIFLLDDKNGNKTAVIENDCRGAAEKITTAVLTKWLRGGGMDVAWESLIEVLRNCKLISLANNIQEEL